MATPDGKPAVGTPRKLDLASIQQLANAVRARLEKLEGAGSPQLDALRQSASSNTSALVTLGLRIDALAQQVDELRPAARLASAFAELGSGFLVKRSGVNSYAVRTLIEGENVTITNATGDSDNPVFSSTGGGGESIDAELFLLESGELMLTENNNFIALEFRDWVTGALMNENGLDLLATEADETITTE